MQSKDNLAYATCLITGDDIDPHFWTEYFNVVPTIIISKGKLFKTPSGRISSNPGRTGVWGYSTKGVVAQEILAPHIRYLVEYLKLPRPDLSNLLTEKNAKMRISCFWSNYAGDRVPSIDNENRHIIEISGGYIEIDEYPQRHKLINEDGKEIDIWV